MSDSDLLASVVVAVHADQRARQLLDSLSCQSLPASRYEVIVVENGSRDLSDVDGLGGVQGPSTRRPRTRRPPATSACGPRAVGFCC